MVPRPEAAVTREEGIATFKLPERLGKILKRELRDELRH